MPKRKLAIRRLKASEVTFTVSVEQDELEVRGNAMASDDPEADRELENEILSALDAGNIEAWCCITVTATWEGIEGTDHLGGCSFLASDDIPQTVAQQVEDCIQAHGMRETALSDLNQEVERQALQCLDRIRKLKVVPVKRASKR